MTIELPPDDPRLQLLGLAELVPQDRWWRPNRLPTSRPDVFVHPELQDMADMAAGARMEFTTDATGLETAVDVSAPTPGEADLPPHNPHPSPFDVFVDDELTSRIRIHGTGTLRVKLPEGRKDVTVWLPQWGTTQLGTLRLKGATMVQARVADRPRWIAYGSSITHCRDTLGPSETWPALLARSKGWDVTNLGFGGQALLDPVVARYIRDSPADGISLCLGINTHGRPTFYARTLGPAIVGFVQTVRDGHPDIPLFVSSPIVSPAREPLFNGAGLRLADIRRMVEESVRAMRDGGDHNLHLVRGLDVLRPDESALLPDGLHPGPEGYRLLAERFGAVLSTDPAEIAARRPEQVPT